MTKIQWTDETWNPVSGCSLISEGCAHCYAKRMATRLAGRYGYPKKRPFVPTLHPDKITKPMYWKKPRRVFAGSMTDLFHNLVPFDWVDMIMAVISCCPQHTFMILTKREDRMAAYIEELVTGKRRVCSAGVFDLKQGITAALMFKKWTGDGRPNLWLGVSTENQARYDQRWSVLRRIPAAVRFISAEPLLGEITLGRSPWPDWVICGPETGAGARPCGADWIANLSTECMDTHTPFFDKRGILRREWPNKGSSGGPPYAGSAGCAPRPCPRASEGSR